MESLKDYAVQVESLQKRFKNTVAVKDIGLKVKYGEIFGLIGPDGAGKTTTIQMLCGLLAPDSGLVFIDGSDVALETDAVRIKIGYMSQDFTLYLDMTVEENIDFVARLKGMKGSTLVARKKRLLAFSRLEPFRDRRAADLSGGMKKKLALCCALAHSPRVIVLDEPTTAVDPVSRYDLWRILYEFNVQGITVIIATPYMDEAERCNRVALVQEGEILACDTPHNLKGRIRHSIFSCRGNNLHQISRIINEDTEFSAQIYGDRIRFFLPPDARDLGPVESCLTGADGLALSDIKRVSPNMDDVYMELLGKAEGSNTNKVDWISFNLPYISGKAIKVSNISMKFGDFVAVDNVSFEIEAGKIFGLLGPNGAGKTTLIKMMCGLHNPTMGNARVAGFDIRKDAARVRSRIGYMSQLFSLYPDLTVEQNLDLYASIYGISKDQKKARKEWIIELAGLKGLEKYLTSDLVGGWKQKLSLGCAVIHQPPVVFLDEPTSGVDPKARQEFWDVIYRFSEEGITVVVTTHFMDEAERCNILGLMSAGKLISLGSPEELKKGIPLWFYELTPLTNTLGLYDKLLALDCLAQIALFGEKIHVASELELEPLKKQLLSNDETRVKEIKQIEPLLEDVFVYHVR
jgi:ABC-2 type transport system ATP-binding protein